MGLLLKLFRRSQPDVPPYVLHLEVDREDDGRYIADVTDLPGVMAYGATQEEATRRVAAMAFRVIADRIEHGETHVPPRLILETA